MIAVVLRQIFEIWKGVFLDECPEFSMKNSQILLKILKFERKL